MKNWQLDLMEENERARAWEKLNAPDEYDKQMREAATDLKEVVDLLGTALNWLGFASHDLQDTPMQAKVDSFFEQLESIEVDLDMMREHYERGERE